MRPPRPAGRGKSANTSGPGKPGSGTGKRGGSGKGGSGKPANARSAYGKSGPSRFQKQSQHPEGRGSLMTRREFERQQQAAERKEAAKAERARDPDAHGGDGRRELRARDRVPAPTRTPLKTNTNTRGTGVPAGAMRIAKALARAGLCSRREAERWIEDGRVTVNGERITSPARDVSRRDRVLVDGRPLPEAEPPRIWKYHKPKGLVTTHVDPEGRRTVFEMLPPDMPRVISIGRLDYNTEGLLLLTNDGELARHLELPATGWLRRYRVRAHGRVTQSALDQLAEGVELDGVQYGPIEARLDEAPEDAIASGRHVWLSIGLREGKNREVRRILGALGLEVSRLLRVSFGPFQLLDLPQGDVEHIRRKVLADQLGREKAEEFGLIDASDDD